MLYRTFKMLGLSIVAAVALSFASTASAHDDCYPGGYGGYGGYGYGYRAYLPIAPLVRPPVWHDTSHYDYHPGHAVRHGNHFHYQPGHFHLHRTGHWH